VHETGIGPSRHFARFGDTSASEKSGHRADIGNRSFVTHRAISLASIAAVRKVHAPFLAMVLVFDAAGKLELLAGKEPG
jgi:hypothetical protein